ncbi:ubiquitin carboxyl-terminal hydrolase-like [Galleria mellonella]|uniref:Ubiquitin carboxyl-terminal hydrolase n=1 Tax=Galleria mellonella TaxID=7137 RepID=A0A6J1WTI6_GALME|nr:ubiquitin carboxyl-terminal hydrolase-like [Galleria mellonella]
METDVLVPIESNPEVMTKFLQKLGVPPDWSILDVIGLDALSLSWVPRPVISVLLLYPISASSEEHKKKEESEILSKGQEISSNVFYMKQCLSNVCGTIALVHSVANNLDKIQLADGYLKKFLDEARTLDPDERGILFTKSANIINAHKELAEEGQTNSSPEDLVNHHFIAFVHKDGMLYELDGNKAFPINHGPTTAENLLEDAAKICMEFINRDPDEVRFTVMVLSEYE